MLFHCEAGNDLYRVLSKDGRTFPRFDTLKEAIEAAEAGSAVLSLADWYPKEGPGVDEALLELAAAKGIRLYIEYPSAIPGLEIGEPAKARWERLVVTSEFFEPDLNPMRILGMHGCWYLPVKADGAHLSLAKVAGYNTAVYGLPETTYPILFELPGPPVLVATSKLSHFVTGRYAPTAAWKSVWERILAWLCPQQEVPELSWTPVIQVKGPDEALPENAELEAFRRSIRWFESQVVFSIDEKKGVLEGFESFIDHNGEQNRRAVLRADCIAEAAMLFAYDWALHRNPTSKLLATQMLDYVWSDDFYHSNPESPMYGLVNWYDRRPVFYGDDNARVLLPTLAAARLLGEEKWNEKVLTCLLANLRTTGSLGFRHNSLWQQHFEKENRGWKYYRHEAIEAYRPHFQAYPWACYILGYALTGYDGFMERTRGAIWATVERFPKWRWTNGLTQEIARMLLPLAFLVRLEDTVEHRAMLNRMAGELLRYMQPSGAIQEQMGALEDGTYGPPSSNEAYGTAEASLIQENGDPASDLLYTMNYALLGLHEAVVATKDPLLVAAEERVADFLCRVQISSPTLPALDGAWMRAFDYEQWEYWGSSADLSWGPWCVETGWTNTWIPTVFAMRILGDSLFNTEGAESFRKLLPKVLETMEME